MEGHLRLTATRLIANSAILYKSNFIASDRRGIQINTFFLILKKTYIVGTN